MNKVILQQKEEKKTENYCKTIQSNSRKKRCRMFENERLFYAPFQPSYCTAYELDAKYVAVMLYTKWEDP